MNLYSFTLETHDENKVLADNFKNALSYANTLATTPILNNQQHSLRSLKTTCQQVRIYKDVYKHSNPKSSLRFIEILVWFVNFGNDVNCYVAARTLDEVYEYIGGEHKTIKDITACHFRVYLKEKTALV